MTEITYRRLIMMMLELLRLRLLAVLCHILISNIRRGPRLLQLAGAQTVALVVMDVALLVPFL